MTAKTNTCFPWPSIILVVVGIPVWILGATAGAANAQIMILGNSMLILGLVIGSSVLVYGHIGKLEGRVQVLEQNAESEPSKDA